MRIILEVEDFEPGQTITIIADGINYIEVDDPDPGEEAPEEEVKGRVFAMGGKK